MTKFSTYYTTPETFSEVMVNLERAINDLRGYAANQMIEFNEKDEKFYLWYRNSKAFEAMHNCKLIIEE